MLRLRYWRLKRGLTLKELQALTYDVAPPGISYQQLSAYELGTASPSVQRLPILAEALGITVGQLFMKQIKPKTLEGEVIHA